MQEEETLLQLFGAFGGHFQVEFSYGTIPAVFITSLFVCVCVGVSKCVLLPHGKQRVHSVAFQGCSVLHEMITFCKE